MENDAMLLPIAFICFTFGVMVGATICLIAAEYYFKPKGTKNKSAAIPGSPERSKIVPFKNRYPDEK